MNIKIVEPRGHKKGDINFSPNGSLTILSDLVKQFKLDQKRVLFAVDQDDKDRKYLFMTIDETAQNPKSVQIKKIKSGSYQITVKALVRELKIEGKKAHFVYLKKITEQAKPFFQFERVGE